MISLTPLGSDHFPFLISPFLFSLSRPPFFPLTPLDRPRAKERAFGRAGEVKKKRAEEKKRKEKKGGKKREKREKREKKEGEIKNLRT